MILKLLVQAKTIVVLFVLALCFQETLSARHVGSSAPYLSGDTFRAFCDFYYDELTGDFSPELVRPGNCIFVKTDLLEGFFIQKHPYIKCPYILISHNSDHPAPGPCASYLDDPKIVAWFAQNVDIVHPKLHPIPIGIANKMWLHGITEIMDHCRQTAGSVERTHLAYMNFNIGTCVAARQKVYEKFVREPYCWVSPMKDWGTYLLDLAKVKFVLSPRGNGLDCLRTWEALYMRSIPIVLTSPMDTLFEGLPVIIVNDWDEVTEEFLEKKYAEMSKIQYCYDKLFAPYWVHIINFCKQKAVKEFQKNRSEKS